MPTMTGKTVRVRSTACHSSLERYHTRECCNYPSDGRDIPLSIANKRGLTECKRCSRENQTAGSNDPMKYIRQIQTDD